MNLEYLEKSLKEFPAYRLNQAKKAIFGELISDWNESTTLPKDIRDILNSSCPLTINYKVITDDFSTKKVVIKLADNSKIEMVIMTSKERNTLCVSSQVGCPMKCSFCATGTMGFKRNLTKEEIIEQVILAARLLKTESKKLTNIVFMGMGEPLLNLENVLGAIKFLNQKDIMDIGIRRFSISTCGIIPGIEKIINENLDINIAISLHAVDQKKRSEIMQVNSIYPLEDLSEILNKYYKEKKRKIMFEYIMIHDLNIKKEDAKDLFFFFKKLNASYILNLIPYNKTESKYDEPNKDEIKTFKNELKKFNINFVERTKFGQEIDAACGQLVNKDNNY